MKYMKWIAPLICLISVGFGVYPYAVAQYGEYGFGNLPKLDRGVKDKTKGQIIAIGTDPEIVAWCNFEKAIVVTATNVLCVYNGVAPPSTP